jgi:microcystin-dependent protein
VGSVVTNAKGAIAPESGSPYYVQEGSYTITFSGGTPSVASTSVDFDAVSGSGPDYLGLEAVKDEHIASGTITQDKFVSALVTKIEAIATNTSNVTALQGLVAAIQEAIYKPGDLKLSAATTISGGFLKCEGGEVSIATYKVLYEALGGTGNSTLTVGAKSGNFFLPDYRERVPVGTGSLLVLGVKGGEATHTLTISELAKHHHVQAGSVPTLYAGHGQVAPAEGNAVATSVANPNTEDTGGGAAHNNMQPYTVCNVWIKY